MMEKPEWKKIYQDDEFEFGKEEGTYVLLFNGNAYCLASNIYEPCLFVKCPENKMISIHNAFAIDEILSAIRDNGSISMMSGNEYDVKGIFSLIKKAIEINKTDVDLVYVEQYRFFDYMKEREAVSFETAISPSDFGLKNCKMTAFIHSKKVEWTGDGRFYLKGMEKGHEAGAERFSRVISNQVRFGYGFRTVDGKKQYFAWHGYPNRNDDFFTTAEITEEEFLKIEKEYPSEISADRETAELFRSKYVDRHKVLMEAWNRTL